MSNAFKLAFRPNSHVSGNERRTILFVWLLFGAVAWVFWPSRTLPTPLGVLHAFGPLINQDHLANELVASYSTNLVALALTTVISLIVSYATVLPGLRPVGLFLSKLRFLGSTGLPLFFTLLFATGHAVKIWMLVFWMSVFFITSMVQVVAEIPKAKFDHARVVGMGEWRVTLEVVVLGTLDQAIDLLRQNAAIGWMMLTMVEGLVRSEGGVGVLLLNQNRYLRLDAVVAIQLTILALGLVQDAALGLLRRMVCPHAALRTEMT